MFMLRCSHVVMVLVFQETGVKVSTYIPRSGRPESRVGRAHFSQHAFERRIIQRLLQQPLQRTTAVLRADASMRGDAGKKLCGPKAAFTMLWRSSYFSFASSANDSF